MKKAYLAILLFPLMLAGCKVGQVTRSGGMENQSYLQFVQGSDIAYPGGVEVFVDNNDKLTAVVDKIVKRDVKGNTYVIQAGTRHLKVVYQGKVLYEKDIVVAGQETKQIKLP